MFLRPQCTFGTKNPKNPNTGTPWKIVLFQKAWRKRVKEYPFNLSTERGIVEDCVAVILPPQLTLKHLFCNYSNFFPEHSLLSQISNSGVLGVYRAYIWLRFIKWNAKALTHVACMHTCVDINGKYSGPMDSELTWFLGPFPHSVNPDQCGRHLLENQVGK